MTSIPLSTGNPTNYNGATYLDGPDAYTTYQYLRLSYAGTAISAYSPQEVRHCQFIRCGTAIAAIDDTDLILRNVLLSMCGTAVYLTGGSSLMGQHVTADQLNKFFDAPYSTAYLTNSILTAVTNIGTNVSLYYCTTNASGSGVYQTVGGASYYLAVSSTNRDAGTTNISASLLADLKKKTTYPPVEITTNFSSNTTLGIQAARDTDAPDRGYLYDPIDFVMNGRSLTNVTLVVTNGAVIGNYGDSSSYGIQVASGGKIVSTGTPALLNWFVRYNTVQEQATTNWSASSVAPAIKVAVDSAQAQFRFTAWSVLGGSGDHFNATIIATNAPWFTDCQFAGGTFTMNPCSGGLTNCLWERVSLTLRDGGDDLAWYLYNNLFRGGKLTYKMVGSSPVGVAYDNLFDQTTIVKQGGSDNFTHGYNGYVTNQNRLTPNGTGDKILTNNPVYLTNWLGKYYYPTNDGMLSLLLNTGSRNATNAGLYHYTVTTNQVTETNSTVDIGFHWVAVNSSGAPIETDGDGLADYFEDRNGNGTYNAGDIANWNSWDTDGDGLSDAFERLVRQTDPTVGENRIQSENVITGTTNWQLSNPVTVGFSHGWPTNDADTTPEIEGFASATSANVSGSIELYVDVRNGTTNFSIEIFRLGWYGGLGGRKMSWDDNGYLTNTVLLPSRKQPVPYMNPTNGLIDCLSGATNGLTNTNLIWQRSYSLTIPPDWVSGVYVAKLTTGTNVTPQTTGKQSYIIFTVREDARSSHFLFQSSVATYQAYNPWGGSSVYPYPHHVKCDLDPIPNTVDRYGGTVSFNRPYAPTTCENAYGYGSGAGDFLTILSTDPMPGFEYNMVRWLERQGYDTTYSTSIDTHRPWPANKTIKTFLSVGHDEYWSGMMRTNTQSARDQGVNLGFFCANSVYWKIHFDETYAGERVFSVNKFNDFDLWRAGEADNPELNMIGQQFAGFARTDMTIANPRATNSIGGVHWAYENTGLTNGQTLPGLLGYEVDGCFIGDPCQNISGTNGVCPESGTIRLADSIFSICSGTNNGIGHSYVTLYTATNGAQVFSTGSMWWNWGLDDFGSATFPGTSRVHSAAQQMTHNVLRTFSGRSNAPVIFVNADTVTSGNWTNLYGSDGYWIADTTLLTNLPAYAQVSISNQNDQVWENPSTNIKALLKPGFTNRIASAWTTTETQNSTFTIDLNLASTNKHQIALYCADWLATGTILQKIEVFESTNTSFSLPLDTRDFDIPPNGVYFVWNLSGHKIIRITKKDSASGNKAMISGLFFGGP